MLTGLETIAVELAKFDYIQFDELSHTYRVDNKELISVTTLIHQFQKEFASDYWAERKALERGVERQVVLDEWAAKATQAQLRGTSFHEYMERNLNKLELLEHPLHLVPLKPLADKFLADIQGKMIAIKSEFRVGDNLLAIAGTVDQLFFNLKSQQLEIWDWKSNSKFNSASRYTLINGLEHLADCEHVVYSLQLLLYRHLLVTNSKLKIGGCYIAWFNENNSNYKIYPVLNLQAEVELIYKQRFLTLRGKNSPASTGLKLE